MAHVEFTPLPPLNPEDRYAHRDNAFWDEVTAVLDTRPGDWALVIRNTGAWRHARRINDDLNPQVPADLYEAAARPHAPRQIEPARQRSAAERSDLYLRRRFGS